jgi:hypothetical protein
MMNDYFLEKPANKTAIAVGVAVLIAIAGGGYYWYSHRTPPLSVPEPVEAAAPAPATASAPEEPRIEHPVPAAGDATQSLPSLAESDKPVSDALGAAAGDSAATSFLVPSDIIRHIVVTVDNLPRQKLAVDKRPIKPTPGEFIVDGDELHATLDAKNFQRYAPFVNVLRKVDVQSLASVYFHFYPLFQKVYQDLGYPNGYFNDRLVQVIDLLLATPQILGPIDLVRPNVMYTFADPSLELRPAGQKVLLRMGPDNASVIKAKLAELRAIITAAPPKR